MADEVKLAIERVQAALDSADRLAPAGVAVVIERRNDLHTILGALTSRPLPTDEQVERAARAMLDDVEQQTDGNWPIDDCITTLIDAEINFAELARVALIAGRG